jgi:hypothetical protein
MILFIARTWFLWWMFGMVLVVRWFHLLSVDAKRMGSPDPLALEKEEEAYILTWQILHKAQVVSLFDRERAH